MATQMKWISVEDRLPEIDKYGGSEQVIVYHSFVGVGYYGETPKTKKKRWNVQCGGTYANVTHWMPLPDPPEST